eukprot:8872485-Lingulodinium_polyedra.AAC.1
MDTGAVQEYLDMDTSAIKAWTRAQSRSVLVDIPYCCCLHTQEKRNQHTGADLVRWKRGRRQRR